MKQTVTIGWLRSDGDMDVLMTINLRNARERNSELASDLETLCNGANVLGLTVLEREDMPDVLTL